MTDRRSEEPASHAGAVPRDLPDQQAGGTIGRADPWDPDPGLPEPPGDDDERTRRGRGAGRDSRLAQGDTDADEPID
ncbi:hypothetical protein AQ490_18070 [Wenjunlia vitaminophila]|uniref:Uncharacterized protein n=1 Tax=Wenjunlia vitaminophila TaxID=76728 RepID=A0A0T6LV20_WENVI|nr:hypothetical protein [Wenjunlia vitaminophila]KRV49965.1 hypothetical protein AQ490_18070 [Wenjunlia vitaminophila]